MATSETPRLGDFGGGVPALLVNRREPCGIASVTVDDEAGAFVATQYLASRSATSESGTSPARRTPTPRDAGCAATDAGSRRAASNRAPELVAETSFDEAGGNVAATRLLRLDAPPDRALRRERTRRDRRDGGRETARAPHPDDLSVVGFHDAPFTSYLDPPLTTVRMPLVEMGRQAVDHLLALLNGELVEDTMVGTPPELVVRASAGLRAVPRRANARRRLGSPTP